jgi:HEAT repeat protein
MIVIAVLKQLWSMGLDQKIDAKVVLPALIRAVRDEDVIVQRHAAMVIGVIGPEAKAAVPVLIEELKNWQSLASSYIQDALRKIGIEAVPELTEALEHEDPYLQREAAQVLCSLGATAAAALPMLERKL